MPDLDLDAIETGLIPRLEMAARLTNANMGRDTGSVFDTVAPTLAALVTEVRRLRAENEHLRHGGSVPPPITTGATT